MYIIKLKAKKMKAKREKGPFFTYMGDKKKKKATKMIDFISEITAARKM